MTTPGSPPDNRRPGTPVRPAHLDDLKAPHAPDSVEKRNPQRITNFQFTKWAALAFFISGTIAVLANLKAPTLPTSASRPELHDEPLQTALTADARAPFEKTLKGHTYTVTPQFNYHISGMVVEMSDAMGWKNITHKSAGDFLNTHDLCVIWGANAESLDLSQFEFTHGDWTCYVSTHDSAAWAKFKMDGLSNNHVLPATPEIEKELLNVRIGDQIVLDGQLVDYSIDNRPPRRTSTVRSDTGNGACEIIFVTGFKFLKRHNLALYRLGHLMTLVAALSLFVLAFTVFALPFIRHED